MTPLEELQAAHKRLSGLRDDAAGAPWFADSGVLIGHVDDAMAQVAVQVHGPDADLIVTLHRCIPMMLQNLADEIHDAQLGLDIYEPTLNMALAINWDGDGYPDEAHDHGGWLADVERSVLEQVRAVQTAPKGPALKAVPGWSDPNGDA